MPDPQIAPERERSAPTGESFLERHNIHPVAFAFASLFIVFVLYQVVAGSITLLLVGSRSMMAEHVMLTRALTMAGQILFILVPTVLLARLLSRRRADVFRWRVPTTAETVLAVLGLLFLQQILQIYLLLQERLPWPEELRRIIEPIKQMMEEVFRSLLGAQSVPELFFVLLVAAVVPSVVEEMFFRGLIQESFARVLSPLRSAVAAGIIFGIYHLNPFDVVALAALGIYFGVLRIRSNSILLAMTAHFINNSLAVFALYFGFEDEFIFRGSPPIGENLGVLFVQLVLYLLMFLTAFSAYLRVTERVVRPQD
jgi:hypothetical protein